MDNYKNATDTIDSQHPTVIAFAEFHSRDARSDTARAIKLFYAIRDLIRYDPYQLDLTVNGMKASTCLERGHGWCVPKAILLAACCRVKGIPARLGFADVRNHLSTERMREFMQTDIFYWHGYADLWLDGQWVKATPAFNIELCRKFNMLPLEFDGENDSLYHPFDVEGNKHMEYVRHRGTYQDLPLPQIVQDFKDKYPQLAKLAHLQKASFEQDVTEETRSAH